MPSLHPPFAARLGTVKDLECPAGAGPYRSGGSSKAATRAQVEAEWRDLSPSLENIIAQARSVIAALRDVPRPLYVDERALFAKATASFAEQIENGLTDLLGDLTGPVCRRADNAGGIDLNSEAISLCDVVSEREALEREHA